MDRAKLILRMATSCGGQTADQIDPANLFGPGRIEGDDADEFWTGFAQVYAVDLTALRDYLHYNGNEPPVWQSAWGVGPDGRRLPLIPIGVADLDAAAEAGSWTMAYPDHRLRQVHPVVLPLVLAALVLAVLAYIAA